MNRQITVKGTGKASVKPNWVQISLILESECSSYDRAVQEVATRYQQLMKAITENGFPKEDLKTKDYDMWTGRDENKKTYFDCRHKLLYGMPLDTKELSKFLGCVQASSANPEFDIRFTTRDVDNVQTALLATAAIDARKKAELLAEASGSSLGAILNITYNWEEIDYYSHSRFEPVLCCSAKEIRNDVKRCADIIQKTWEDR